MVLSAVWETCGGEECDARGPAAERAGAAAGAIRVWAAAVWG